MTDRRRRFTPAELIAKYGGLPGTNESEDTLSDLRSDDYVVVFTDRSLAARLAKRCPSAILEAIDHTLGTVELRMDRSAYRGIEFAFKLESDA